MDAVLIEEEELNLLLILYDYVDGFGEMHWFSPKDFKEDEGIDLLRTAARPLSFLSEHGLVVADKKTPDRRKAELFRQQEQIAPLARQQQRREPRWSGDGWVPVVRKDEPDYMLQERQLRDERCALPSMMVYVTGQGANYVRMVRRGVEEALKPPPGKRNGLVEMPAPAGQYVRKALEISREVVIGVACNILATLVTGK